MKVSDYTISVDSAKIDNDSVVVTFTVDNTSGAAQVNLPVTAFDATGPDSSQSMDEDILCSDLAVSVPQGKKVTGNICWKANGATATKGVTVHYDAGAAGKINWVLP